MRISDWSSDVCSSDLRGQFLRPWPDLQDQMRSSLGIGNSMALSGQNGSPIRTRANNRAADRCASALPGILDVLPTQHDPEDRHIVDFPTSLAPDGYGVPWGEIGRAAGRERGCR